MMPHKINLELCKIKGIIAFQICKLNQIPISNQSSAIIISKVNFRFRPIAFAIFPQEISKQLELVAHSHVETNQA
jgi:hypothetical protein